MVVWSPSIRSKRWTPTPSRLIAADASCHVLAGEIEVTADRGVIERPHREPRRIETAAEDRAVLRDGEGAVERCVRPERRAS